MPKNKSAIKEVISKKSCPNQVQNYFQIEKINITKNTSKF